MIPYLSNLKSFKPRRHFFYQSVSQSVCLVFVFVNTSKFSLHKILFLLKFSLFFFQLNVHFHNICTHEIILINQFIQSFCIWENLSLFDYFTLLNTKCSESRFWREMLVVIERGEKRTRVRERDRRNIYALI